MRNRRCNGNGNGTLSQADGAALVLTRPDGTGAAVLAEGLTEPAVVSAGEAWRVLLRGPAPALIEIDPRTGTAGPSRPLTLPAMKRCLTT